tara:strand:+ start:518 stop:823 length:306 start_codon:yes stop_codon:yes gene_type:complete
MRILSFIIMLFLITPVLIVNADSYNESTSSQIIKEAETNYKKVLKVKNAWRDTKKIIKKAKKAHNKKDYKTSTILAKKALNEADMAFEQYEKQKENYRFLD